MDFRQYDPTIGRFFCVDLLAESSYGATPYHFTGNNPIIGSDPTGLRTQEREIVEPTPGGYAPVGGVLWRMMQGGDMRDVAQNVAQELHGPNAMFLTGGGGNVFNPDGTVDWMAGAGGLKFSKTNFITGESGYWTRVKTHDEGYFNENGDYGIEGGRLDEIVIKSFWQKVWMPNDKTVENIGNVATSFEAIANLYQYSGKINVITKLGPAAGYIANTASVAKNVIRYENKQISGERFAFKLAQTGSSALTGAIIGGEWGGPYGFLGGLAVGGMFDAVELTYDTIVTQFRHSFNGFVNSSIGAWRNTL